MNAHQRVAPTISTDNDKFAKSALHRNFVRSYVTLVARICIIYCIYTIHICKLNHVDVNVCCYVRYENCGSVTFSQNRHIQ